MSVIGTFFGRLFGTDKALEKVVDTGRELLDEAFYTDQEEAADRAAAAREARGMIIDWVAATTPSRLARRVLAFSITFAWLFQHIMSTSMLMGAIWVGSEATSGRLISSSQLLDSRSDGMQAAVMLILGFYFAAPFMGDIAQGALKKFGDSK